MAIEFKGEKRYEGKRFPQVLAILVVSLGTFSAGIHFTWSSPFSPMIVKNKVSSNGIITGMIVMSVIFFRISEYLGRKKSIILLTVPQTIVWIIVFFARTKWEFYIARFIAGTADAIVFGAIPPYVGEITVPVVRDFCGNLPTFASYGGQFFVATIGSFFDVQETVYICVGIPIVMAMLMLLLPESPYQLIKDEKLEEAKTSIQWFQRLPDVENEFQRTKADVKRQNSESATWLDLIKIISNRRALRAGIFLRVSQQLSGVSVFATYTQSIFQKAGGNFGPQYSAMIYSGSVWIANLVCSIAVAKYGRRPSYFLSLLTSGMVLLCMSIYFFLEQFEMANLQSVNWIPLAGMMTFVVTFSIGLSVIPTLMLGELFSASIKCKGLGILMSVFGVTILITSYLFHMLVDLIGLYCPFFFFAMSCFVSSFLTLKWVPETKGKTLEEIQQSLKK
ncbi:facilitated trehalose transporter Tret1-like isoform X2 [Euwallacea similis]|uniref:facilitated trehalose transporter Tret1-like isoform X2 n=1 Tax=Euwallacea similis TaxID=1736056 RepID=UPI00344D7C14